jgi:hypothetical protein
MLFELGVVGQIGAEKVLFPTGHVTAAEHDRAGLFPLRDCRAHACRNPSGIHLKCDYGFP